MYAPLLCPPSKFPNLPCSEALEAVAGSIGALATMEVLQTAKAAGAACRKSTPLLGPVGWWWRARGNSSRGLDQGAELGDQGGVARLEGFR